MKVLHINSFGRYSTGNIAGEILQALPNSDEKLLIYGRDDSDYSFAKKMNTKQSAMFHVIMNKLFGGQGTYSYFNTKRIIREIDNFNPDVIHLHNLHGYYINYEMLFKYIKKKDIKVIWTLHDCWAFTGYCAYFDYINCDRWKDNCGKCPVHNKVGYKTIIDTSKRDFNSKKKAFLGVNDLTIVTPSQWLANLTKESFLGNYNIRVINNGINTNKFVCYSKPIDKEDNKKIVLGLATPFVERKGYSDFIKLAGMLSDEYKLVMVGLSDSQIEELPKNVLGIKKTKDQNELVRLYNMADVFLNLTYEDNFPTTNLESLCCGTPVITYKTGGSVESVNEGNGIVVTKGDLNAVVDAITKVIEGNYNRDLIAKEANEKYSIEEMVNSYIQLYKD